MNTIAAARRRLRPRCRETRATITMLIAALASDAITAPIAATATGIRPWAASVAADATAEALDTSRRAR